MPRDPHDGLGRRYPGADSVACDGSGWLTITYDNGNVRLDHCPACADRVLDTAVVRRIPERFRSPISLPADVLSWIRRSPSWPLRNEKTGLYLAGGLGTGKTHTAWGAMAGWCGANRSTDVVFCQAADLFEALRPGGDAGLTVRECQKAGLLVIDDLGAEKASRWTAERLVMILDARYADCAPLVITTNYPEKRLAGALAGDDGDPGLVLASRRIVSRLAEMCTVIPVTGPDRRMEGA